MRAHSLQNNFALMKCVSGRGQRSDTDSRFAQLLKSVNAFLLFLGTHFCLMTL